MSAHVASSIISAIASAAQVGLEVYRAVRGDERAIVRAHQRIVEIARRKAAERRART